MLAVTGGTGFVGRTFLAEAIKAGWAIRALARQPQDPVEGITWVAGSLSTRDGLADLVTGADTVIHIAGVTNSPTEQGFIDGNVGGTRAIVAATHAAGLRRFVHVSSLVARAPELSIYGRSKADAETLVKSSGLDWTIVRPPAVYGPGDKDHLDLFKAARLGIIPLPPKGRISEIEVSDLARALLAVARDDASIGRTYEVDDGTDRGWSHVEFAHAIGAAVGRSVWPVSLPASLVRTGARLDRLLRGPKAKLTPDRAAYFCHDDWVIDPALRPPPSLWLPTIPTDKGLAATARAYRKAGQL